MLEIIRNVLDNSECAIGIVCDFQIAFDMVDNDILLSKQSNHGMERIAFDWFKDYVWNRHQVAEYNKSESEHRKILCRVPHGCLLSTLLFLIYIRDLPLVSNLFMYVSFAHDTNIFCTEDKLYILVHDINFELVFTRARVNKLSLNIEMANSMLTTFILMFLSICINVYTLVIFHFISFQFFLRNVWDKH